MTRTQDPFFQYCRHCGRQWDSRGMGTLRRQGYRHGVPYGANTGFIAAASDKHEALCKGLTPAQRRARNKRDEARWAKIKHPAARITNDPDHPGLKDDGQ